MASVKFTIKSNHAKVIAIMAFVYKALSSSKGTTELDFDFYTTFLSKNFIGNYDGKISIISVNVDSIEFVVKDYSFNVNDFSLDLESICKYPIEISHEKIDDDMEIKPISFKYDTFSHRFIWGLDKE